MQLDPQLKQEYTRLMDEYLETGHMRRLTQKEMKDNSQPVNYIPWHIATRRQRDEATSCLQCISTNVIGSQPQRHSLLTVAYGTTCAPYLAIRTLKQLCIDEGGPFPEAARAIKEELYVDDFLIGADNLPDARRRRDELVQLLNKGGFELKKWVSNQPALIEVVPAHSRPEHLDFCSKVDFSNFIFC